MNLIQEAMLIIRNALDALARKEITREQLFEATRIPLKDLYLERIRLKKGVCYGKTDGTHL